MTEYTDLVEKRRIQFQAEEWGNGIKYIHANKGIIETAYQNGDIDYEYTNDRTKDWTAYAHKSKNDIISRFLRWRQKRKEQDVE